MYRCWSGIKLLLIGFGVVLVLDKSVKYRSGVEPAKPFCLTLVLV